METSLLMSLGTGKNSDTESELIPRRTAMVMEQKVLTSDLGKDLKVEKTYSLCLGINTSSSLSLLNIGPKINS